MVKGDCWLCYSFYPGSIIILLHFEQLFLLVMYKRQLLNARCYMERTFFYSCSSLMIEPL